MLLVRGVIDWQNIHHIQPEGSKVSFMKKNEPTQRNLTLKYSTSPLYGNIRLGWTVTAPYRFSL